LIDHLSSYATDFAASRAFYEAGLGVLGHSANFEMVMEHDAELPGRKACAFGPSGGRAIFWVIETKVEYTPRHLAFSAQTRSLVDAFYEAALAAGGRDHGAPGPRPIYHESYYGAFVLDPDDNNIEAVCHLPA